MLASTLLLALGSGTVDIVLDPASTCVPAGDTVEIEISLSAAAPTLLSAVDVILSWDPAQLEYLSVTPSSAGWLLTGFLPDPDGINLDLSDGDALYTSLANPVAPLSLPPDAPVATLLFRVLDDGELQVPARLGQFGESAAFGDQPGENITGALPAPIVFSAPDQPSVEVVRLGTPANPGALLPGVTSGPTLGDLWDPVIDHTSFMPGAVLDLLVLSATPTNIPLPPYGTLLCLPPFLTDAFSSSAGVPFALPVPASCAAVGVSISAQGLSLDGGGAILLTNALDITIGAL